MNCSSSSVGLVFMMLSSWFAFGYLCENRHYGNSDFGRAHIDTSAGEKKNFAAKILSSAARSTTNDCYAIVALYVKVSATDGRGP